MKKIVYLLFFVFLSGTKNPVFPQQNISLIYKKYDNAHKLTKDQKEGISNATAKAQKYILNHQWDEAEEAYKLALQFDSSNLNTYLQFVSYLKERNGYRNILSLSEKLLPVYKRQAGNDQLMKGGAGIILTHMGEAKYLKGDTAKAEKDLKEAVDIFNQLCGRNEKLFCLDFAVAQRKLGTFYSSINDFDNGQDYLVKSLSNLNKSVAWNSAESNCEKASVYISLASNYLKNNVFDSAKSFYKKSLEIANINSVDCLSPYSDNVAVAKRGLAQTYERLHDSLGAEKLYKEVIEYYETMFQMSPEHYIDKITTALEELMKFYKYNISSENFCWNEKLFRYNLLYYKIYHLEEDYVSEIADLYSEFGNSCMDADEYKKADTIYIRALALYRKRSPFVEDYKTKQVIVLSNLGLVHDQLKDYALSESDRLQALKLCTSIYEESSDMEADICLFTQNDLLSLYLTLIDSLKSDTIFLKFKQRTEMLYSQMQRKCTEPPTNVFWEPCSPKICGSLSYYLLFLKRFDEAAIVAHWGLKRNETATWIKVNLAHALLLKGKYEESEKIYQELKILKEGNGVDYAQQILKDLSQLEKNGIINGDVDKIRKLMKK